MDRPAIVTGAAAGIGRAVALRLARDGHDLHLLDRDAAGLETVASAVTTAGVAAEGHVTDLADTAALVATLDRIVAAGAPGALVNNAGIAVAATAPETSLEDWSAVVAVNLTGCFVTCRAVIPAMAAAGGGAIVNVSSAAGLVGITRRAAYCASKAGVIGLTRALAADHARDGIRANAICPGTVATDWVERIIAQAPDPQAQRAAMAARQLDGRMGTPEEVAEGIAFLIGAGANFVNGSAFVMDGGMTAV